MDRDTRAKIIRHAEAGIHYAKIARRFGMKRHQLMGMLTLAEHLGDYSPRKRMWANMICDRLHALCRVMRFDGDKPVAERASKSFGVPVAWQRVRTIRKLARDYGMI